MKRSPTKSDWDDEAPIFFGSGSAHTLTDGVEAPHRLAGLRSVKTFVSLRDPPKPRPTTIGFHIPRKSAQ